MEIYDKSLWNSATEKNTRVIETGKGAPCCLFTATCQAACIFAYLARPCRKIHCFAPDLRGFGDSSYNKPFGSLKELAGDVKLFADRMGLKEAYVIGWSPAAEWLWSLRLPSRNLVKAVFSIEGASHKGYPIFKKDEKGMPIVGSLYSSPDEMGEDPVQVKPVSLAFAAQKLSGDGRAVESHHIRCEQALSEGPTRYL